MARIIHPTGAMSITHPQNGKKFTLEELQHAVEGYIERVPTNTPRFQDSVIYCNEEGIIMNKPFNIVASAMLEQRLFGNILICAKWELE